MLEMEQWRATAQCVRLATHPCGFPRTKIRGGAHFAGRHRCAMILTVTSPCHRHVPSGIYNKELQNDALKAPSVTLKAQLAFALYRLEPCQFVIDR